MKIKAIVFVVCLSAAGACRNANAATGYVGPVYLESVGALTSSGPAIGHQPGNIEIKIKNGFTLPSGVSCDTNYITTLKSADVDHLMFAVLSMAKNNNGPIYMWITDDSAVNAFPGRCSLVAVQMN